MPHECNICGKSYKLSNSLKNHYLVHTDDRPFGCKICDKFYKSEDALKAHQKTHSNEKPYKCNQCGKVFGKKNHLNRHQKVHEDDLTEDLNDTPRLEEEIGNEIEKRIAERNFTDSNRESEVLSTLFE